MTKAAKPSRRQGDLTIGRAGFAKIGAIEGIKLTGEMAEDFREFDRKGLSAQERRRAITRKYGAKT